MRRGIIFIVLSIMMVFSIYGESLDTADIEVVWPPENSTFIRFGFSSSPVSSMGEDPSSGGQPDSYIAFNTTSRSGTDIVSSHAGSLYAYWQMYSNDVFYIYIGAKSLTKEGAASIPFTVSWEGGNSITSTDTAENSAEILHMYDTSITADADSEELTIQTTMPEGAVGDWYEGYIYLELRRAE